MSDDARPGTPTGPAPIGRGGFGRRGVGRRAAFGAGAVALAFVVGPIAGAGVDAGASHARAHANGTVHAAKVSGVGTVLVDAAGRTLYVFAPDKHKVATCTGECAGVWPPLYSSKKPGAGSGARSKMLGTVKDVGGKLQVTYDGWPLYTFTGDSRPGQAHGQGIDSYGGKWSTISPAGRAFVAASKKSSTTTTKPSGGYGGY